MKLFLFPATMLSLTILQGCVAPIGKDSFACPNEQKGGVCAGPRAIYELTNTRENLEDIADDESFNGYYITTDEDGNTIAVKSNGESGSIDGQLSPTQQLASNVPPTPYVYEPRDHLQQHSENYQRARTVPENRFTEDNNIDSFSQWPKNMEPLAPEPLSVLEPPKVMRILLNSYKDERGNLVMPGYMFVQVESETWSVGEAASLRPQRVIPLEIRERANQEEDRQRYTERGVSSVGHRESSND